MVIDNLNVDRSYSYKVDGHTFSLHFLISRTMRRYRRYKYWPVTTQCLIVMDNRILAMAEVVKHEKDKDDPAAARIYAAEKAFPGSWLASLYKEQLLELVKEDKHD